MSEHQHYEFIALDGPISDEGLDYARGCSSRAEVSRTRWCNVYNFGDFHGSVEKLLEHYDVHLYIANWGQFHLALAFPDGCLDEAMVQPYLKFPQPSDYYDPVRITKSGGRTILWLDRNEDEGFGWVEGAGILDSLVGIRDEVMSGDFRAPFLTWLAEFCPEYWQESGDSKALMPPIPPNLNRFSYALKSFAEQLEINPDCLAAACGLSADAKKKLLPVSSILDGLSTKEMKALLARVAEGDGARVMAELNRLRSPMVDQECQRMSCMKFADLVFDVRKRRTEEEEGKEAEERERKAIEYRHHLETIFKDNVSIWESLDPLMDNKIASAYDKAAGRLKVLRDAYGLFSKDAAFQNRLAAFRDRYSRRPAMMRRIEDL